MSGAGRLIVHVADRLSHDLLDLVEPESRALGADADEQVVLCLESPGAEATVTRKLLEVAGVRVETFPGSWLRPFAWRPLRRRLKALAADLRLHAVQYHDTTSAWMCIGAADSGGGQPDLVLTPHALARGPRRRGLALRLLWQVHTVVRPAARPRLVAMSSRDARMYARWSRDTVELAERRPVMVVGDPGRHEAAEPSIVVMVDGLSTSTARFVSRMVVLLGAADSGARVVWSGPASARDATRLRSVGVEIVCDTRAATRARLLGSTWICVVPRPCDLPSVAQAMALGVPCVARDSLGSRDLIVDGATGLLCASQEDLSRSVARLIDDGELRHRLGHAACCAVPLFSGGAAKLHPLPFPASLQRASRTA